MEAGVGLGELEDDRIIVGLLDARYISLELPGVGHPRRLLLDVYGVDQVVRRELDAVAPVGPLRSFTVISVKSLL